MVAHVLLTGVHQWLVVPALQLAEGQRLGHEPPAPLAGEHLLVNRRDVPFGPRFGEKIVEQLAMLRRMAEFFLFARVVAYVEEQARVVFAVDKFVGARRIIINGLMVPSAMYSPNTSS